MEGLSHRERVLYALEHKRPDRVPMDLGGSVTLLNDAAYFRLIEFLKLGEPVKPYRRGRTANYYDERILDYLDIDFRHVWLHSPKNFIPQVDPDGTVYDEWGIPWRRDVKGFITIARAVLGNASFDEVIRHPWPDAYGYVRDEGVKERADWIRQNTDYALVAKHVISGGALDYGCFLRGTEQFLIDLLINLDIVEYIVSKVVEVQIALYDILLSSTGPQVDIVEMSQDYGTQNGPLISPKLYRLVFKKSDARVVDFIKSKAPQSKVLLHSCGSIVDLIDDFIDVGIDIINPVQPFAAGMDHANLKKRYGNRICFHGGIDIQRILPGDISVLRRFVAETINTLGSGGGYILAPANNIQGDTPPENIVSMYRTAKEMRLGKD
ncbi:MAG: uroporphyrinogen decarboxylase [Firmicutes bacterium]|nr:uroporphyrinogen decarboxylase [Bacillota bacterium]